VPSAAVGKAFADGFYVFADGFGHSAKGLFPVVHPSPSSLDVAYTFLEFLNHIRLASCSG
jgi:hypothetical protein